MDVFRYSRWDNTQQVFPVHQDDLMEQLSDHLIAHGDVSAALRSMVRQGIKGRSGQSLPGIQDLLQQLRSLKRDTANKYNLSSVLEDMERKLEDVIQTERRGIDRRLEEVSSRYQQALERGDSLTGLEEELLKRLQEMARRHREYLDNLPQDPAGKIQRLQSYEFMDGGAKAKFEQLIQSLQQPVVDTLFQDLARGLKGAGPQQFQALKDMIRELNNMLEQPPGQGRADFSRFMQKYGKLFGNRPPASLEELVEQLRQQAAAMTSLLKSLSPRVRQELEEVLNSIFRDQELREELARLAMNLQRRGGSDDLSQEFSFYGDEPLSLQEALKVIQQLHRMDALGRQLKKAHQDYSLLDVDPQLLSETMGPEAKQALDQLKGLSDMLEEAGYVRRVGERLELTPKGMRKIGEKALQELFLQIKKDRLGEHQAPSAGYVGEMWDDTVPYQFGMPFNLHLHRTLMNAVSRQPGVPVRVEPEDFEVNKAEHLNQAATVLMLDLSLSMAMRGNFLAAKKVALALDNLIRTQFPRDSLFIVGFSTYAREVRPESLPYLTWDEMDPYTNIQHGLALSGKLLSKSYCGTRQIIIISDGEPTAHLEGGQLFLQYPPSPRTLRETLKEVKRCTQMGITINTFMLERSSYLRDFVEQMTRINRGRVLYTSPDRLGEYILVDYMSSRRRLLS